MYNASSIILEFFEVGESTLSKREKCTIQLPHAETVNLHGYIAKLMAKAKILKTLSLDF